jgi:hypothetical protein
MDGMLSGGKNKYKVLTNTLAVKERLRIYQMNLQQFA